MKNAILHYIFKNQDFAFFDGREIIIKVSYNPVNACLLDRLVKKHFNVVFDRVIYDLWIYSIKL